MYNSKRKNILQPWRGDSIGPMEAKRQGEGTWTHRQGACSFPSRRAESIVAGKHLDFVRGAASDSELDKHIDLPPHSVSLFSKAPWSRQKQLFYMLQPLFVPPPSWQLSLFECICRTTHRSANRHVQGDG